MKNKTPLQELLAAFDDNGSIDFCLWVKANKDRLLIADRAVVSKAWVAGLDSKYSTDPGDTSKGREPVAAYGYPYYDKHYEK